AAGVILLQEAGASEPLPFDASQVARAQIPALSAPRSVFEALVGEEAARNWFERADHRAHGDLGAPDPALSVRMVSDVRRDRGTAYNVLAKLPGTDAARTVVIGAHYDHLGLGGEGSLAPGKTGEIHNGADDNASGTATVLEMARILSRSPRPAGDVIFALWSGEELGLLGSEYWVEHPTLPLQSVRANLNLDMVGRGRAPGEAQAKPNLIVLGAGTSQAFEAWLSPAAAAAGLTVQVNRSGYGQGGSDHMSFMNLKIPVMHFFTGTHADYHKPSDDSDKVDCDSMARIAVLGIDLLSRMQAESSLAWNESEPQVKGEARPAPPSSNRGFSVWFGSVPSYAFEGPGVLLSGTSPGSPAEKAGLLAGDVLLQIGSVHIGTIHDFVYALRIYKPGDVVVTRFARGGIEQSVRISLANKGAQ
ncbi:MAG: M20/M25/M40 family metallo-hydrolase, partial [Planctomycetota bacterium]